MSARESWDVIVVGAGPAGSTAALSALRESPSARVLLIDRDDFPRDKCCGDGIAPHVMDVLGPLGASGVVAGWVPVDHLELSRRQRQVAGVMARPVWVIPREVFDARLVEHAVAAGAELRRHRVRAVRVEDNAVVLDDALRARVVIGADGAHSTIRSAAGQVRPRRRAFAIRGYVPTTAGRSGRQVIRYGERRQPSYAWSFDRGDGLANVGYGELAGESHKPSRDVLLRELEVLLPGSVESGTNWRGHHLPLSGWATGQPEGRLLLAGDAAGLINPMTGEGIYYAVATGASAGKAAVRAVLSGHSDRAGQHHRLAIRRLLDRHLHHTWAAARLSRRPTIVEAGIVAASRDRRNFDALVELGLGDGRITPRLAVGLAAGLFRSQDEE